MKILTTLAAALAATSVAHAGTITQVAMLETTNSVLVHGPINPVGKFVVFSSTDDEVLLLPMTSADVGTTWVIDINNADNYDFDWHHANEMLTEYPRGFLCGVDWFSWPGQGIIAGATKFIGHHRVFLERIEFTLVGWQETPEGEGMRYSAPTRVVVYATIPEPSTLVLLVIGIMLLRGRR